MRETSLAAAGNSNRATTHLGASIRPIGWAADVIRRKAKEIWRNKTAAELAVHTGLSVYQTEKILRGERGMGLDAFASLMASSEGIEFFGAIVDAMPEKARKRWYVEFERAARHAELRRRKELLEAEMERDAVEADQLRFSLGRRE